jgi:hypothetical protein
VMPVLSDTKNAARWATGTGAVVVATGTDGSIMERFR